MIRNCSNRSASAAFECDLEVTDDEASRAEFPLLSDPRASAKRHNIDDRTTCDS